MTAIELEGMSREEKLGVMHALWEDLARDADAIKSPEWHGEVLRETEKRVRAGTEQVRDWDEAKAELRERAR